MGLPFYRHCTANSKVEDMWEMESDIILLIQSALLQRMKKAYEISWATFSGEYPPVGLWKRAQQSLGLSFTLSQFNQSEHAALKRAKSERSNPSSRMWSNPVKRSFLSLHEKHNEYKIENILSGRSGKLMTETKKSKEKRVDIPPRCDSAHPVEASAHSNS